tara:strand:+ start:328 stop:1284 length:957 start_codon:yes stop_codon:yes gene_type:complete
MEYINEKKLLSIIVPCYQEEEVIDETFKRLSGLSKNLKDLDLEIIFVDDGSKDSTPNLIRQFTDKYSYVKSVFLSRNFGHQIAVTAGIDSAQGDALVIIDADLQDPPEVIYEMIKKWKQGYEVVYGKRVERKGETLFKKLSAKFFYIILNMLSDIYIPLNTGDFRLISKEVANALKKMPEKDRFIRGMVSWVGFKQYELTYKRHERFAGKTKYPLKKMLRFSLDAIFSFSTKPLQISVALGIISSFISLLVIMYALFLRIFTNTWIEGWTAIMIAVLFIGGVQMLCIGLLGNYVGRIYNESRNRPLYIIRECRGFEEC